MPALRLAARRSDDERAEPLVARGPAHEPAQRIFERFLPVREKDRVR